MLESLILYFFIGTTRQDGDASFQLRADKQTNIGNLRWRGMGKTKTKQYNELYNNIATIIPLIIPLYFYPRSKARWWVGKLAQHNYKNFYLFNILEV